MLGMVSVFLPGSRMKDMVITVSRSGARAEGRWLVDDQNLRGSTEKQ